MTGRLEGRTAIITAAGQGIGRATALAMAAEGARVLATDINEETLQELQNDARGDLTTTVLDVLDADQVSEIAGSGEFDILFNCAGFVHHGTILAASEEEWDFAFDLNVKAMFRMTRAVLPGMLEGGKGSIVNMSSAASSIIGAPHRCVYGASKSAVIGLTKSVAKDYITQGVRCNAICPGTVESPSLHDRLRATGDYEAAMKAFIARQAMGRIGTAEEIAALAVYLASEDSAFTTGQTHIIDGGWAG